MYLTELLDRPLREPTDADLGIPYDIQQRPELKLFCQRIIEQAKLLKRFHDAPYDLWTVEHCVTYGWPFVSDDKYARVVLEEDVGEKYILPHPQFWVNYEGGFSLRYAGLIGNWFFYFVVFMIVISLGGWGLEQIRRRLLGHPTGHCQTCGYNLTGNVSGICPECGNAVPKRESAG